MLVLSRKPGQRLFIRKGQETITVLVHRIEMGRCRIGIDAPACWDISRDDAKEGPCVSASEGS